MKAIVIGGTPGTGKTETAEILSERLGLRVLSLGELAREHDCLSTHDDERDTEVIDEDCLVQALVEILDEEGEDIIIEGHYIDLVPSYRVKLAIILRTHPDELKRRLADRDYKEDKIRENVEAEVIGVCQLDALDAFGEGRVVEIDTTGINANAVAEGIIEQLNSPDTTVRIDWMQKLESEGKLDQYLD